MTTLSLPSDPPLWSRLRQATKRGVSLIRYWLFLFAVFIVRGLPLGLTYRLASLAGDLVFLFWRKGRANTIANMRHVLEGGASDLEVRETARRSFRNYLRLLVDLLRSPSLQRAEGVISGVKWEYLDRAFQEGKGVLLILTHFGSWDLAAGILASRQYRFSAVADSMKNPYIDRWVRRLRQGRGIATIPLEGAALRIYRALRHNEAVGIGVDRPLPTGQGVTITFFGQEATWPAGAAALALHTGARIITGYLIRDGHGKFIGEMLPPLDFQPSGDEEEDRRRLTQKIAEIQEGFIRRCPDQWYMFRPMWPQDLS